MVGGIILLSLGEYPTIITEFLLTKDQLSGLVFSMFILIRVLDWKHDHKHGCSTFKLEMKI